MNGPVRIAWIDYIKAISMFLVVLGHCHLQAQNISQYIYSFHVQLFFFISGLLCKQAFRKTALANDIKYLIAPYLFYGMTSILFTTLTSHSFNLYHIKEEFVKIMVGMDTSIGPIWFLPALFICKQLFYIFSSIKKTLYIKYLLLIIIFIIPLIIHHYHLNIPLFCDSALFGLPFFIIGNISMPHIKKGIQYNRKLLFLTSILLSCTTIILSETNGFVSIAECLYGHSLIVYYVNAMTGILAITCFCLSCNKANKFVFVTSYGSIVTLGIHTYFFFIFNYYLPKLLHIDLMTYPVYIGLIYTIIIYVCCYYFIILIDRLLPKPFGLRGNLESYIQTFNSQNNNQQTC